MGNSAWPCSRLRVAAPLLLTAAILIGTGVWLDGVPSEEEEIHQLARCDEAQTPLLAECLTQAYLDGRYEKVWFLASSHTRRVCEEMSQGVGEAHWPMRPLARWAGYRRADLVGWDPGAIFLMLQRATARKHPDVWRLQMDTLRDLGPPMVVHGAFEISDVVVEYRTKSGDSISARFHFIQEEGGWRLVWIQQPPLRPLARKVAAFLPKLPWMPVDELEIIVEIGPDGIGERKASRLTEFLRGLGKDPSDLTTVLLELSADLPWSQTLVAMDAVMLADVREYCFADTTTNGRPPPGIRVNGVDLDDLEGLPPLPEDHPALERIIRVR